MHPSRRILVEPLDKASIREAGAVLSDSFWSYPEVVHVIPNEGRRRHVLPRYLTADCVDALRFDSLFGAFHDRHLVGVGVWLPPRSYPLSKSREIATLAHMAPLAPWVLPAFAPYCELKRRRMRATRTNRTSISARSE